MPKNIYFLIEYKIIIPKKYKKGNKKYGKYSENRAFKRELQFFSWNCAFKFEFNGRKKLT